MATAPVEATPTPTIPVAMVERAAALLEAVDALLAELVEVPLAMPTHPQQALDRLREVEQLARRVRAVELAVSDAVDRSQVWKADGHRVAHQMVGHACRSSAAEERRRDQSVRALRDLPLVAAALREARIGRCQVERIARTWANPRVRAKLIERDAELAALASRSSLRELHVHLAAWEATTDETGTAERSKRNHLERTATMVQRDDGGWDLAASCGSLDGAQLHQIWRAFCDAESEIDWAEARAVHGVHASTAHLARTDAQRRFDALRNALHLAADGWAHQPGGAPIETIIVLDEATFARHLRRIAGHALPPPSLRLDGASRPEPHTRPRGRPPDDEIDEVIEADEVVDLADVEAALDWRDEHRARAAGGPLAARRRTSTIDGHFVDPTEAVAAALVGHVRRAVVSAAAVTTDLGRRQRLFPRHASLAAKLARTTCYWPACRVPASRCQTDHLEGWASGGPTDQVNAGIACGHHNRLKEHGFTVRRDARTGAIHVHRPDGTRIE